tara:strand:- start:42 stop:614 length:573 start_codon:yes stop_codon:yes gene_type:complete
MKYLFLFFSLIFLYNCSKPKTVLICGDHVCVNKDEAEQFFEENLTIEVKILSNKKKNEFDLVQINLENKSNFEKKISVDKKKETNKDLKILSNAQIKKIKSEIKTKKKNKNKKIKKEKKDKIKLDIARKDKNSQKENKDKKNINNLNKINANRELKDICSILDDCNIEEISKYLIKQGKNRQFPDITLRE